MTIVMTEGQRAVLIPYRDCRLAIPLYRGAEREAYYSEDFLEHDSLAYIVQEVFLGESDITKAGIQFLKEFFGHERLARLLVGNKNFRHKLNEQQTVERLEGLVPNEIGDWLEKIGAWEK